jgi:hypothetical protein
LPLGAIEAKLFTKAGNGLSVKGNRLTAHFDKPGIAHELTKGDRNGGKHCRDLKHKERQRESKKAVKTRLS